MDGSTLFIRVLSFLDEMAKDQVLIIIQCYVFICTDLFSLHRDVLKQLLCRKTNTEGNICSVDNDSFLLFDF